MDGSITLQKVLTGSVLLLGIFYLAAPKEWQDKYAPDVLIKQPQSSCARQTIGAVLIAAFIYLNTQRGFTLFKTPNLLGGEKSEGFGSRYTGSSFPDYETFVI